MMTSRCGRILFFHLKMRPTVLPRKQFCASTNAAPNSLRNESNLSGSLNSCKKVYYLINHYKIHHVFISVKELFFLVREDLRQRDARMQVLGARHSDELRLMNAKLSQIDRNIADLKDATMNHFMRLENRVTNVSVTVGLLVGAGFLFQDLFADLRYAVSSFSILFNN